MVNPNFINLDECVINALSLFQKGLPNVEFLDQLGMTPLVAGSGNAYHTANILFGNVHPILANESDYKEQIETKKRIITGGLVISSSGSKDAPRIASRMKEAGLKVGLLTCNPNAPAKEIVGETNTRVFPANPEMYTYNTSTYGGMIFARTGESPFEIRTHLERTVAPNLPDFTKYDSFYVVLPDKFSKLQKMLQIKFEELFGRRFGRDVYTLGFANEHATDVIPTDKELAICFGCDYTKFKGDKIVVPLPEKCDYGGAMMTGYYTIGKIQRTKPFFRDNIDSWCAERGKKPFG